MVTPDCAAAVAGFAERLSSELRREGIAWGPGLTPSGGSLARASLMIDRTFATFDAAFPRPHHLPDLSYALTMRGDKLQLELLASGRDALCQLLGGSGNSLALTVGTGASRAYNNFVTELNEDGGSGPLGETTWKDVAQAAKLFLADDIAEFRGAAREWGMAQLEEITDFVEHLFPGSGGSGGGESSGSGGDSGGGGRDGAGSWAGIPWLPEVDFKLKGKMLGLVCDIDPALSGGISVTTEFYANLDLETELKVSFSGGGSNYSWEASYYDNPQSSGVVIGFSAGF